MWTSNTVDLNQSPELITLRFNHWQMTALRQIPHKTRYVRPDQWSGQFQAALTPKSSGLEG